MTEADESEVTMNPNELHSEGIKYRTADIERNVQSSRSGPISVMYHTAPQKVEAAELSKPKPPTL